jgi:FkbM family methyltransferase
MNFLKPGMIFWDIGAHLGEYALLASRSVGDAGRVEAFEPQPGIFELLTHNTGTNKLRNVALHQSAVTDCTGVATLTLHPDPSKSYVKPQDASQGGFTTIAVPTISLDEFYRSTGEIPQLVKVDVEGAERFVLRGASCLLELPPSVAPVWLVEYDPQNCATFGYHPDELVRTLSAHGYRTFWIDDAGRLEPSTSAQPWAFGRNLVATKRELL